MAAKEEQLVPVPSHLSNSPVFLSVPKLQDLVLLGKDYVTMHGGLMRTSGNPNSSDTVSHVPFLLFPSPFPRQLFELALSIQTNFHDLVHKMALDREFLFKSLHYIIESDPFTKRLWNLYEEVYSDKREKPRLYMGTTRNDYMLHKPNNATSNSLFKDLEIKQVEYNMIAVSFGPLESIVGRWHKFVVGRLLGLETSNMQAQGVGSENEPAYGLAQTIVDAARAYRDLHNSGDDLYVLIVADSPSRNIFDQRWVELAMLEIDPAVKTIRRSMAQLRSSINQKEVENSGRLFVEGHEIAAVYFRTGYNETDYDFPAGDWDLVRRPIELSLAAKAPCVAHQLANYKKVQQVIAKPGQLEHFGIKGEDAERMRQTFTELYSLDFDDAGEKAVQLGLTKSADYVMKPMQEGGGHNYFGDAIVEQLQNLRDKAERQNFILMGIIRAPTFENVSIAPGESTDHPRVNRFSTELGIYGGFVVVDGQMIHNKPLGYLLRSKQEGVSESGVAAGFGRIDSAYFV